jgi:hypothetical protein
LALERARHFAEIIVVALKREELREAPAAPDFTPISVCDVVVCMTRFFGISVCTGTCTYWTFYVLNAAHANDMLCLRRTWALRAFEQEPVQAPINYRSAIALLVALSGFVPAPAAQRGDYSSTAFIGATHVTPLRDNAIGGETIDASCEVGYELGIYELGIEWKPSDRFGSQLAYLEGDHDVEVDPLSASGGVAFRF